MSRLLAFTPGAGTSPRRDAPLSEETMRVAQRLERLRSQAGPTSFQVIVRVLDYYIDDRLRVAGQRSLDKQPKGRPTCTAQEKMDRIRRTRPISAEVIENMIDRTIALCDADEKGGA